MKITNRIWCCLILLSASVFYADPLPSIAQVKQEIKDKEPKLIDVAYPYHDKVTKIVQSMCTEDDRIIVLQSTESTTSSIKKEGSCNLIILGGDSTLRKTCAERWPSRVPIADLYHELGHYKLGHLQDQEKKDMAGATGAALGFTLGAGFSWFTTSWLQNSLITWTASLVLGTTLGYVGGQIGYHACCRERERKADDFKWEALIKKERYLPLASEAVEYMECHESCDEPSWFYRLCYATHPTPFERAQVIFNRMNRYVNLKKLPIKNPYFKRSGMQAKIARYLRDYPELLR